LNAHLIVCSKVSSVQLDIVPTLISQRLNQLKGISNQITSITSTTATELQPNVELQEGRLGPRITTWDKSSATGTIHFKSNDLNVSLNPLKFLFTFSQIESHTNFSSIRANVCVYKGKWMYEITLGTAGIQQIGWCPLDCPFTNEVCLKIKRLY
jgi:hypothetical protein